MPQPSRLSSFLAELKRRRVFRVAAFYGGIAFVIVQVIDGTFELMGIPPWVGRLVVVLLALGFPAAVGLAWVFDITKEGVIRTPPKIVEADVKPEPGEAGHVTGASSRFINLAAATTGSIALAALAYFFLITPRLVGGEPIPIAVVDFVNETNEEELDGLSGMLITALEQSRRLSVVTRSRMFDLLKELGKDEVEHIDETLGREIAKQAHLDVLIIASIRKLGRLYTIDLKALDPEQDEYLFTAREDGEGQESILAMLDRLATKTRKGLKERAAEIEKASDKVAEVTTVNLDAYQHYFQGEELISNLKFDEAEEQFRQAIALDSTFALAHYRLAYTLAWRGDSRAEEPIRKAMQYIHKVPEKERYMVQAEYAQIEGNTAKAIAIWKDLLKLYPEEKEALYEVGDISFHRGDLSTAITYLEKVLALDPTFERALQHIGWTYWARDQYDRALVYAEQHVARAPSGQAYRWLGDSYLYQGDLDKAFETYTQALELFPTDDSPIIGRVGWTYAFREDFGKARAEFEKLLVESRTLTNQRAGYRHLARLNAYLGTFSETSKMLDNVVDIDLELNDQTDLVATYAEQATWLMLTHHDRAGASERIGKALELENVGDVYSYAWLMYAYLSIGEFEEAFGIAEDKLSRLISTSGYLVSGYARAAEGDYTEGIKEFQKVQRGSTFEREVSNYELGKLYLASGDYKKALETARRMQRFHTSFSTRAVQYPRSFYLMGQTHEEQGNAKLAIENYEKFLDLWKDADEGLPELIDARARFARMRASL